jgi:hypothetical protein
MKRIYSALQQCEGILGIYAALSIFGGTGLIRETEVD